MQGEIQTGPIESPIKEKDTKYQKLGIKDWIIKLYEDGKNPHEIYKILKEKDCEISDMGIRKVLLKSHKLQKNVASDIQVAKKFKQMILDYDKELKGIMDEVKEARDLARESKDLGAWSALLGRAMQVVELFSKIAGDFRENKVDINLIFNEVDERVRANKGIFEEAIDIDALVIEEDKEFIKRKDEKR